ncbi:hypothetical protein DPMN_068530 [Dreissena polymorpha]|uniref:Uncharacterized protein n=1 Tax=Dreissena polymorpha TaxID=45954 RepID=A0A9D4BTP0_DREPO|nr:hypothetical protein DPMN_068530 [Dreissena polymorpha]
MPIFIPGPLTKFMELQETLAILKGPHVVLQEIPTGWKDGMFFVVDNSDNIIKRANGNKSDFWDDCGSRVKGATPCSTFIEQSGNSLLFTDTKANTAS